MDLENERAMKLKTYPNIECRYFESSTSRLVVNTVNPYNTVGGYRGRVTNFSKKSNNVEISDILDNSIKTPYTGTSNGLIREIMQDYEFNANVYINEQNSDAGTTISTNQASDKSMSQHSFNISNRPFDTPAHTSCSKSVPKTSYRKRARTKKYNLNNRRKNISTNENCTVPAPNEIPQAEKTTYCRPLNNMYNEEFFYKTMQRNARLKNIVRKLVIERQKEKQQESWNNYINELKNKHGYYINEPARISQYVPNDRNTSDFIADYYNMRPGWMNAEPTQLSDDFYEPRSNLQPNTYYNYPPDCGNMEYLDPEQYYESNSYCFPISSEGSIRMLNRGRTPEHLRKYFGRKPIMTGRYPRYTTNRGIGSRFKDVNVASDSFNKEMNSTKHNFMQTDISLNDSLEKMAGKCSATCREVNSKEIPFKNKSLTKKTSIKGIPINKSLIKAQNDNLRKMLSNSTRQRGKYCICKIVKNIDINEVTSKLTECNCDPLLKIVNGETRATEDSLNEPLDKIHSDLVQLKEETSTDDIDNNIAMRAVECACGLQKRDNEEAILQKVNCSCERLQNINSFVAKLQKVDCACKCNCLPNGDGNKERLPKVDCACKKLQKINVAKLNEIECLCKRLQKRDSNKTSSLKLNCERLLNICSNLAPPKKVDCPCRHLNIDSSEIECACKRLSQKDKDKLECVCKSLQGICVDKVECACERLQDKDNAEIECACKRLKNIEKSKVDQCACKRLPYIDIDKIDCICKQFQDKDKGEVACACKRLHGNKTYEIECTCKRLKYKEIVDVECACKHLQDKEKGEVECVCKRLQDRQSDEVECACKRLQNIVVDKVDCACKRLRDITKDKIECACESLEDKEKDEVDCACKRLRDKDVDDVQCACKHLRNLDKDNVDCTCKSLLNKDDDDVECACKRLEIIDVDDIECACKHLKKKEKDEVDCACCACRHLQNIDIDEVECTCKRLHSRDIGEVECACKRLQSMDVDKTECACKKLLNVDKDEVECACKRVQVGDTDEVDCACERLQNIKNTMIECACKHLQNTEKDKVECACKGLLSKDINEIDCACKLLQSTCTDTVDCACTSLKINDKDEIECDCKKRLHVKDIVKVECECKRSGNTSDNEVECICDRRLENIEEILVRLMEVERACKRLQIIKDTDVECACKHLQNLGNVVDCACKRFHCINCNKTRLNNVDCACERLLNISKNVVSPIADECVCKYVQNINGDIVNLDNVICTRELLQNEDDETSLKEVICISVPLEDVEHVEEKLKEDIKLSRLEKGDSPSKRSQKKERVVQKCSLNIDKNVKRPVGKMKTNFVEDKGKDCICEPLQDIEGKVVKAIEHTTAKPLQTIERKLDNLINSFNSFVNELRATECYKNTTNNGIKTSASEKLDNSRIPVVEKTKSGPSNLQKTDQVLYTTVLRNAPAKDMISEIDTDVIRLRRKFSNTKIENIIQEEIEKSKKIKRDIKELLHTGCDGQGSIDISFDIPTKEVSTAITSSLSKTQSGTENEFDIEEISTPISSEVRAGARMTIAVNTDPLGLLALLRISAEAVKQLLSYMPQLNYYSHLWSLQPPHRPGIAHYVCNICGASFSRPSQLSDHIQQNHDLGRTRDCCVCRHVLDMQNDTIGLFKCKYCGKMFARAYCCELHQQTCAKLFGRQHDVAPNLMLLR